MKFFRFTLFQISMFEDLFNMSIAEIDNGNSYRSLFHIEIETFKIEELDFLWLRLKYRNDDPQRKPK